MYKYERTSGFELVEISQTSGAESHHRSSQPTPTTATLGHYGSNTRKEIICQKRGWVLITLGKSEGKVRRFVNYLQQWWTDC